MLEILGGLIALLAISIYCAIVVGKRTDQRITNLLKEDAVETPMLVRFPDDVLRPDEERSRATARAGRQSV